MKRSLYNSTDSKCLLRAIRALEYNDLTDAMTHAEHIYLVAFSIGLGTKASAEECLSDFFGGESEYKEAHNKLFLSYGACPVGCPMVLTKGTRILTEHLKAQLEAHKEVTPAIYRPSAQK